MTPTQQAVIKVLQDGGKITLDLRENKVYFHDEDLNTLKIRKSTFDRLRYQALIGIIERPSLDIYVYKLTDKGWYL